MIIPALVLTLTLSHLPGFFEPNVGQFGEDVLYVARSTNGMALFTESSIVDSKGIILELPKAKGAKYVLRSREQGTTTYSSAVFVPRYEKLERLDVAPGIDAVFTLDEQGIVQCDFIAREGADPASLEIVYKGVDRIFVDSKGKLTVRTMMGTNVEPALHLYRIVGGKQITVDIQPIVRRDGVVTLADLTN
ncbi:MAG TPA: hypothetical protein VGL53_02095 [Bryobacteraceae bacterium]|jgi:hypothetical protein